MTFRTITVFEDGEIREQERNSKSKFKRSRTIFDDGQWVVSYKDKDDLDCGYTVVYFTDGDVWRGEKYKGKWHGIREEVTYAVGEKQNGEVFNDKRFGDWRFIEKDGNEAIYQY